MAYSYFNKQFGMNIYSCDFQLGSFNIQEFKPIAFYSIKLAGHQKRYKVIEKNLLIIVKTLKWFQTVLIGQKLQIWTDH